MSSESKEKLIQKLIELTMDKMTDEDMENYIKQDLYWTYKNEHTDELKKDIEREQKNG